MQVLPTGLTGLVLLGLVGCLSPQRSTRGRLLAAAGAVGAFVVLVLLRRLAGAEPQEAQQLLNGLFLGSIFALIALGYTMVYGVLKLINFAHGEVFMVGAYVAFLVVTVYRQTPALAVLMALLVAMLVCAGLGVAIERCAYRPLRQAPRLAALITAIGVSLLLQNLALLLLGATPKTIPSVLSTRPLEVIEWHSGLLVSRLNLVSLGAATALMVALQLFVSRTRPGRAMRAVSEDREAAQLMGIDVDQVIVLTFVIGSALAGAGGVLWGLRYASVAPDVGVLPGLKAFVAAVLGGIGSIPGAAVGGLLIGLTDVLVSAVSLSPQMLCQVLLTTVMLVAFWRLSQARLAALPHTRQGRLLRVVGALTVAASCWVVGGLAALGLTPYLATEPTVESLSGSTFSDAVVFFLLIVILIVKPTGLMGTYAPEKV
ncbi:MAG: branched-chain amino acid ABC transporter permease [Fimbriimonadaceae bacterium]|nr:branched-chain amino acid ABC transporter permease [Fimbriimonadaceae bacterium]